MVRARSFALQSATVIGVLVAVYAVLIVMKLAGNGQIFATQQIASGIAIGAIYGAVALALVLIYRSTDVINFAQGEMATFCVFISWSLISQNGFPYWGAFVATAVIGAGLGAILQKGVIAPVEGAPLLTLVIVTLGLFEAFNSLSTFIWQAQPKAYPTPFGAGNITVGSASIGKSELGALAVMLIIMGLIYLFFSRTKLGLASRAAAQNPLAARLCGVSVSRMLTLGWALAAAVGAAAGMLVANKLTLDPNMMISVLLYAFAAAVLGGLDNPVGAVVGGFLIGIIQNLIVGSDVLKGIPNLVAFLVIILVLVLRPNGLLGRQTVKKV
jgi:branched-chain amino acid transport system permease protein